MNTQNFYKFTWVKLAFFLIITLIPLARIYYLAGIKDGPPINPVWEYLAVILFWPFYLMYFLESLIIPNVDWIHLIDFPFILIALAINIFYLYSVSCLINSIFNKK